MHDLAEAERQVRENVDCRDHLDDRQLGDRGQRMTGVLTSSSSFFRSRLPRGLLDAPYRQSAPMCRRTRGPHRDRVTT